MTMVAPNIGLRAQVGPYGAVPTFQGYYATVPRTARRGMGSYRKGGGLGQDTPELTADNFVQEVESALPTWLGGSPTPGGGYVVTGQNADGSKPITYVDTSGNAQQGTVPPGVDPSKYVNDKNNPPLFQLPTWLPWVAGGALLLLLLGYSGVGKMLPARANRGRRRGRAKLRRRGRRGRR